MRNKDSTINLHLYEANFIIGTRNLVVKHGYTNTPTGAGIILDKICKSM